LSSKYLDSEAILKKPNNLHTGTIEEAGSGIVVGVHDADGSQLQLQNVGRKTGGLSTMEVFYIGFCCVNAVHVRAIATPNQVVEALQSGIHPWNAIVDCAINLGCSHSMGS